MPIIEARTHQHQAGWQLKMVEMQRLKLAGDETDRSSRHFLSAPVHDDDDDDALPSITIRFILTEIGIGVGVYT